MNVPVASDRRTFHTSSCLQPSLLLLLPLILFVSPHPSLLGLLTVVRCCWQSVGAGGTQTGAQMGSKLRRAAQHTCSMHTNTHTELCHLTTQPCCLALWHCGTVAPRRRDTNTNTHRQAIMHMPSLHPEHSCLSTQIYTVHRLFHTFTMLYHESQLM